MTLSAALRPQLPCEAIREVNDWLWEATRRDRDGCFLHASPTAYSESHPCAHVVLRGGSLTFFFARWERREREEYELRIAMYRDVVHLWSTVRLRGPVVRFPAARAEWHGENVAFTIGAEEVIAGLRQSGEEVACAYRNNTERRLERLRSYATTVSSAEEIESLEEEIESLEDEATTLRTAESETVPLFREATSKVVAALRRAKEENEEPLAARRRTVSEIA